MSTDEIAWIDDTAPEAQGVERHVQFVEQLLDRHTWAPATLEDLRGRLETTQARRSDPALKLAVIGESSAGKSTFLNAVLGAELLGARITLQTTATATWLRYADTPDLEVEWLDGSRERLSKTRGGAPSEAALAERMDELTTEESIAKRVKSVTLYYPSPVLKPGLAICDTPGSNVENARHTRVAAEAAEACDATLIVNDANVQIPQSLVDFIHRALPADALRRCLCLATKLDTIRGRRRGDEASKAEAVAEVLTTIRRRLRDHLGVEVEVFGCSPQVVLDHRSGEPSGRLSEAQLQAELTRFDEVQRQLWQILERNREQIVSERVLELLSKLFSLLPEQLNAQRAKNETQRRELKQRMIPDLEAFAEAEIVECKRRLQSEYNNYCISTTRLLEDDFTDFVDAVNRSLCASRTHESTSELANSLPKRYKDFTESIRKHFRSEMLEKIEQDGKKILGSFERKFTTHYKNLDTLPGSTALRLQKPRDLSAIVDIDVRDFKGGKDGHFEQYLLSSAGGAGTGAVIGTMLLPGIGTLFGGMVGTLVGMGFGGRISADERLRGLEKDVESTNKKLKSELETAFHTARDQTFNGVRDRIEEVITDHVRAYESRVDEIRAVQAEEEEALARGQATIKADLERIERRQDELRTRLQNRVSLHSGGRCRCR